MPTPVMIRAITIQGTFCAAAYRREREISASFRAVAKVTSRQWGRWHKDLRLTCSGAPMVIQRQPIQIVFLRPSLSPSHPPSKQPRRVPRSAEKFESVSKREGNRDGE